MKRSTKALLIIFVVAAAGLYIYLFAIPKIEGMNEKTVVLEHGDLPVLDRAEVLFVRDETLFGAKSGGSVTYEQDEGAKVRKGVRLLSVEGADSMATDAAIDEVKARAGDAMKLTGSFKANRTAVVSYYADGYEKALSPGALNSITKADMASYPGKGSPLKKNAVAAGDPVYKLTNNNEWYMIYWVKAGGNAERYATGTAVTVSLGDSPVKAEVCDTQTEGDDMKVILKSDMYYKDLAQVRKADAEIVFAKYSGLIVDKKCIKEQDGTPGLFVKQRSGSPKWVPVKILDSAEGKYMLAVGAYYDGGGQEVSTVNYYDEVIADPKASGL